MQQLIKRITREGKIVIAEIVEINRYSIAPNFEYSIDLKKFNVFRGAWLGIDPTQETYDKANKWADDTIELNNKNS